MTTPHSLPLSLSDLWEEFRADVDHRAESFADEGWHTERFIVGEVRPTMKGESSDGANKPGLRALIPDNHFERLAELIEEGDEYSIEIYRRTVRKEAVFLLLVLQAPQAETALFIPLFYRMDDAKEMLGEAEAEGTLITEFRPLDRRTTIVLEHDDPELFTPGE